MVESGATGVLDDPGCSRLLLSGATLVNDGTLTMGVSGGSLDGSITMSSGAHFENAGTFNTDAYESGCGPEANGYSFRAGSGSASAIKNTRTGTFNVDLGSGNTAQVAIPFNNAGAVNGKSGTMQFTGGGVPEHVAGGTWGKESGASLVLGAGTFVIAEGVSLSQVEVTGATVERAPPEGPPVGSLTSRSYASGTVEMTGSGHSTGLGFASAAIEVTPYGTGEWHSLCGPLTPSLGGEFGCSWNTMSGFYPDGHYQLRAQLTDSASPPESEPTAAITVLVDNTPPSGSLSPPSYVTGTAATLSGTASDSGSGVASWQLQITPSSESAWTNACGVQSTPTSGSTYWVFGEHDVLYGWCV